MALRSLNLAAIAAACVVAMGCDTSSVTHPNNPSREVISRMADDPSSFKGQEVTLKNLKLDSLGYHQDQSAVALREHVEKGLPVPLYGFGTGQARLDLRVVVPKDLQVPDAKLGDALEITFVSNEGSLTSGNRVRSITRWEP